MAGTLQRARRALRNATTEDAITSLERQEQDLEERRALRHGAASGHTVLQCGGCRALVRAANHDCTCGFHNDIRGRRNHGGYHA